MNCLKLRAELRENGRSRHVDLSGGNKVSVGEALHHIQVSAVHRSEKRLALLGEWGGLGALRRPPSRNHSADNHHNDAARDFSPERHRGENCKYAYLISIERLISESSSGKDKRRGNIDLQHPLEFKSSKINVSQNQNLRWRIEMPRVGKKGAPIKEGGGLSRESA